MTTVCHDDSTKNIVVSILLLLLLYNNYYYQNQQRHLANLLLRNRTALCITEKKLFSCHLSNVYTIHTSFTTLPISLSALPVVALSDNEQRHSRSHRSTL